MTKTLQLLSCICHTYFDFFLSFFSVLIPFSAFSFNSSASIMDEPKVRHPHHHHHHLCSLPSLRTTMEKRKNFWLFYFVATIWVQKRGRLIPFGGAQVFFCSTLHSWGHSGTTHIHILLCVVLGVEFGRGFNPCRVLRKNLTPFALPLCAAQISNRHAIPLSGVANLP